MVTEQLQLILKQKDPLNWQQVAWLESLAKSHPYTSGIKQLIAKHYQNEDHLLTTQKIQHASVYSSDRNFLRQFLNDSISISEKSEIAVEISDIQEFKAVSNFENVPVLEEEIIRIEPVKTFIENIKTDIETSESTVEITTNDNSSFTSNIDKKRDDLLAAIKERLAEIQKSKNSIIESTVSNELNINPSITKTPEIKTLEKLERDNTSSEKQSGTEVQNSEIKKTLSFTKIERSEKISETKKIKLEKISSENELKKEIANRIKPINLEDSRSGDALSPSSGTALDLLIDYLYKQKSERISSFTFESKEVTTPSESPKKEDIINRFIQTEPSISRAKTGAEIGNHENLAQIKVDASKVVTETMAQIHANQGNISMAIKIYNELSLKFPEKKSYFADQIKKIKE